MLYLAAGPRVFTALQTYLTLLGSTVLIPFICVPPMGGTPTGELHSSLMKGAEQNLLHSKLAA